MNKLVRTTALVAVSLSTFAPNAIADEKTPVAVSSLDKDDLKDVPTIVITPNRYPVSIEQVGSSLSVVEEKEIELKKQASVLDTLRNVPGLAVVQTGGAGRTASIFIRGAESDHTLVLVDGVRVNDNSTGPFNFADLKAENIERIEVLRGAQSVLYGSDAIGGVVNIITKKADAGVSAKVSAEAGSFGTQQYRATAGWGAEKVYTSTTVSYLQTDGISAAAENRGNPEDDSYDNISISNRSGITVLEDAQIDFSARYSNANTEFDGFEFGVGPTDDPNAEQDTDTLVGSLKLSKPITESVTPSISLGFLNQESKGIDPDTEFNNYSIDNQTQSVTTQFDILLPWDGVLTLGHSYEHQKGENKGNFDERRDINSFFLQKQLALNETLFLTAGARYDNNSKFGEEVTYRTTAAYLISATNSRIHASFGTGFKAPSFNELYFPNFGDPNLNAETSWGYDLGFEQKLLNDTLVFDITFFQNRIDDLITFDSETFLAANIEEADIRGLEHSLSIKPIDGITLSTSYTYTDSENKTTGGILPQRPRHRASLQLLATPCEQLEASASLLLVNSRRDSDGAKMDNYEVVNLAVGYQVTDHIKPFVRIDNVFDEDYEEVNGYGTTGFAVYAGIEGSL